MRHLLTASALLLALLLAGCTSPGSCLPFGKWAGITCPQYAPFPSWLDDACRNAGGHWQSDTDFSTCCPSPPYCADSIGNHILVHATPPPSPTPTPTLAPSTTPTPTPTPVFCGGIAGIPCPTGFICRLDGNYPDAGGICVPE